LLKQSPVYDIDVFAVDSMFRKILSFEEGEKVELYELTRIKYHKESIVREIDRRLESKSYLTYSDAKSEITPVITSSELYQSLPGKKLMSNS
jgi:hypothetical protein